MQETVSSPLRSWRPEFLFCFILVLLSALLVALPAGLGRTIVDAPEVLDLGNQWLGFAAFIRDSYHRGHFPLWDPHDLCGMPFLAFSHTASLYLPWVAAHYFLPVYHVAAALNVFFHLSLAAVGAFFFFRTVPRTPGSSFLAAVAYAFSGFVFSNLNFAASLHTGAWLPFWWAAAFALLRQPTACAFFLSVISLTAMILGGDLEMVIYAGLGIGFEVVLELREQKLQRKGLMALLISGALGLFLSGPALVPALELSHLSVRSGEFFTPELWVARLFLVPFYALFQLPIPRALYPPNHGLDHFYLGVFFILLAGVAWLSSPEARRRLLIFPVAVVYLVLFYLPPFNLIFSRVPILGSLIVPLRIWPLLQLFFLLAATQPLDQWLRGETKPELSTALPGGKGGAIFLLAFGFLTLVSLFWIEPGRLSRALFCVFLCGVSVLALSRPGVLCLSFSRRMGVAIFLVLGDLYLLALAWLPMTNPQRFSPDSRLTPFLAQTSGQERYHIIYPLGLIDPALPYHLGLRLHADTIDAFSRLPPRNSALRLARLYPPLFHRDDKGRLTQYDQMAVRDPKKIAPDQLHLLNEMNVTKIISRFPWRPPSSALTLSELLRHPDLYIYTNHKAKPRARLQTKGGEFPLPIFYPASDAIFLDLPAAIFRLPPSEREKLLPDHEPMRVILADSWYPGWRAQTVSGQEIRIQTDELGFRVLQPITPEKIFMSYQPMSFRLGLYVGLATFFCAFLSLIISRRGGNLLPYSKIS